MVSSVSGNESTMVYLTSYDGSFAKAGTLILVSPVASTEGKNVLIME